MPDALPAAATEPTPVTAQELLIATSHCNSVNPDFGQSMTAGAESQPTQPPARIDDVSKSWLWLNKLDQTFVTVFVAVFLMLSGYHWMTLGGWGMQPIELKHLPARKYDFRIDINSASWVEWTQIEGIGEATAQKIIDDHQANGPFRSVQDLLRVKGIGPKTLEKMRPFLREPDDKSAPEKAAP